MLGNILMTKASSIMKFTAPFSAGLHDKFDVLNDPEVVIIDFSESRIDDMSGIEAVNKLTSDIFVKTRNCT